MKKKSPITGKPLRYPAQSLDEKINKLINDDLLTYFMASMGMVGLTINEWWRYYKNPPPSPKFVTFFAAIIVLFCIYKGRGVLKTVKAYKLGRDGERVVGQYLDDLRGRGHRVFHDIIGDGFNLDHVIVSEKGFFAVETKTYSKPEKGKATIGFDGEKLSIQEGGVVTKPITQVTAASKWLEIILLETTGRKYPVKPVILFPGWFVESTAKGKKSDIWVLNPKALPAYIENQPNVLSKEDMMLATFHLCRYIRTKEPRNM